MLARLQAPAAAGQHIKTLRQAGVDFRHAERAHACGGQFQRQRDAFQPHHQVGHFGGFVVGHLKVGLVRLHAVDEQARRGGAQQRRNTVAAVGQRQRLHGVGLLAGHVQHLAAAGQDANLRHGLEQRVHQVAGGVDHVFAVVEHQQQPARLEVRAQRLRQGPAGLFGHIEHTRGLGHHQGLVAQGGQVDEPGPVRELRH